MAPPYPAAEPLLDLLRYIVYAPAWTIGPLLPAVARSNWLLVLWIGPLGWGIAGAAIGAAAWTVTRRRRAAAEDPHEPGAKE